MSRQLVANNVSALGNGFERQPFVIRRVPQRKVDFTGLKAEASCRNGLAANLKQLVADFFDADIDEFTGLRIQ